MITDIFNIFSLAMSYHRVPRAAALKAQQRVKDIQDEKNSIRRIHQGEIRLSEYAYVNPDADPSKKFQI